MEESIYNLYQAYEGKLIDDDFINKVFEIMVHREPCLLPYINDFKISEDESNNRGEYSTRDRKITIYKNMINGIHYDQKALLGIETIRHEMEHARNIRKLEERRNDIESRVLRPSAAFYSQIMDLAKTKDPKDIELLMLLCTKAINYDYDPDERLAAIRAWKYMVNLLKSQLSSKDILFSRQNLYGVYSRGYKDNGCYVECPTYTYLLNTDQTKDLKALKRDFPHKHYSFETRLTYGLPITYQEYEQGILDKVLLQRKKSI